MVPSSMEDVTLLCEGRTCQAHKLVLTACSPLFQILLQTNSSKPLIIVLNDISFDHIQHVLDFVYKGKVNLSCHEVPALLKTVEILEGKCMADALRLVRRNPKSKMKKKQPH